MGAPIKKIIVFEKDRDRRGRLKKILCEEGYSLFSFNAIATCIDNIEQIAADLIIVAATDAAYLIHCIDALMAAKCRLPFVVIADDYHCRRYLASSHLGNVVLIDHIDDLDVFRRSIKTALTRAEKRDPSHFRSFLVGDSAEMTRIKRQLPGLGRLSESVLITGEVGTGKEALARAVHGFSGQAIERFIRVDAAELDGDATTSLLQEFDRRKIWPKTGGAATKNRLQGKWTIYLTEIGRLPDHLQGELLLICESSGEPFRIIAGSSQDMGALAADGRFRKDLYYRLNVLNLHLPPLRQRKEDIPRLANFFTYKFCKEFDSVCLPVPGDFKDRFMQYDWPGNVSELKGIVKRSVLLGGGDGCVSALDPERVKEASWLEKAWARELSSIERLAAEKQYLGQVGKVALKSICCDFMAEVERRVMQTALEATNWNRKKAAAMLDISYKSMLNKIKAHELA